MSYDEELLNTNRFIRQFDPSDIDETEASEFRKWYEEKRSKENVEDLNKRLRENLEIDVDEIIDINDLSGTNPFKLGENKNPVVPLNKNARYKKLKKTVVAIDSRDRNKNIYPFVNNFKSYLGRTFRNIKSIKLISTEFPNTEGVIRTGVNNKIYWVNEEDIDIGFPVYSIDIRPGSYTSSSLTNEMVNNFGHVKRRNGTGDFHYFDIKINVDTDIVTFRSFTIDTLPNNPIGVQEGTGIITVTLFNHGFVNGEIIEMIGVKRTGGIPATTLNGSFPITFINTSQFSYEVNINAIDSSSGGGNVVKIGKQAPMQLLWNTYPDSIGSKNLGYPNENSSESLGFTDPFTTRTLSISNAEIEGNRLVLTSVNHGLLTAVSVDISLITSSVLGVSSVTVQSEHGLKTGDSVLISSSSCIPQISKNPFIVVGVIDNFTFEINAEITSPGNSGTVKVGGENVTINNLATIPNLVDFKTSNIFLAEKNSLDPLNKINFDIPLTFITIDSIPQTYIGTSQLIVNHPSHGFNKIVGIEDNGTSSINSQKLVKITTQFPHNLNGTIFECDSLVSATTNIVEISSRAIPHGFITGDLVVISNSSSVPNIDGSYYIDRIDDFRFSIVFVGGLISPGICVVKSGDSVTITNSDSSPSIDGTFDIIQKIDDYNFNIFDNDPDDIFPSGLTIPGTTGTIGVLNEIVFYRSIGLTEEALDIGGLSLLFINYLKHSIDEIIDSDSYLIRIPNNYSKSTVTSGGSKVRVHSKRHGMDYIQTNTVDGETLNRSVSLEGENYVFMLVPTLDGGTITSSSGIDKIFAKILLSEPPNTLMFNTFLSNSKVYEEAPLDTLTEMQFQIKNNDNTFYNFNDIDYSFSLEITEYIDILLDSSYSTQRGVIDVSSSDIQYSANSDNLDVKPERYNNLK